MTGATTEEDYLFPTFVFVLTDKVVGKWYEDMQKKLEKKRCGEEKIAIPKGCILWVPLNDTA